jgi:lysophospholipase
VALVSKPKLKRGQKPRGSVILSPGRTEYIEKHADTALALLQRGFAVLDCRSARTGLVGPADRQSDGRSHGQLCPGCRASGAGGRQPTPQSLPEPRILVCHSMGGAIGSASTAGATASGCHRAAACSAPRCGACTPSPVRSGLQRHSQVPAGRSDRCHHTTGLGARTLRGQCGHP